MARSPREQNEIAPRADDAVEASMPVVGRTHEETLDNDERIRVDVLAAPDGRFAYRAECGYDACDGRVRDRVVSAETFATKDEARDAGVIRARQLAGIDAPEA